MDHLLSDMFGGEVRIGFRFQIVAWGCCAQNQSTFIFFVGVLNGLNPFGLLFCADD